MQANKSSPLMKCGHTAMAIDGKGNLCCVICDCYEIENNLPNLEGRLAKCDCCGNTRKSSLGLAFFEYRGIGSKFAENKCHICGYFTKNKPLKNGKFCYANSDKPIPNVCINKGKQCVYGPYEYDSFYCGCRGWD